MNDYNLFHSAVPIEPNNRESLLNALRSISDWDSDFNGSLVDLRQEVWDENGYSSYISYARICMGLEPDENTDSSGEPKLKYKSNQDYYIDCVKNIDSDEKCIKTFLAYWLGEDNFYKKWEYSLIKNDENKIVALSVAEITCY